MENESKTSILIENIKAKYLTNNPNVKSIKQLDFYLTRAKTAQDKKTINDFNSFLSNNLLLDFYQQVTEPKNSFNLTQQQLKDIESKVSAITQPQPPQSKNDVILEQVISIYRKHIESFENGAKVVFKKPWFNEQVLGMAKNANTGKEYQNGNSYLLGMLQEDKGLDLPFFLNNGDIKELGISENNQPKFPIAICAKLIELYLNDNLPNSDKKKWISLKIFKSLTEAQQDEYQAKKVVKHFPLFHHSQFEDSLENNKLYQKWISGFSETKLLEKLKSCNSDDERKKLFDPKINAAKNYIEAARSQMGIDLLDHKSSCHYSPAQDAISLVNEDSFVGDHPELAYLGVLAHELSHATGHESRLKRKLTGQFGSKNYGFEELVAESSSLQLLKQFNLPSVLDEQSASYIYGWLQTQKGKNGKDFLKIACQQGNQAKICINDAYDEFSMEAIQSFNIKTVVRMAKGLPELSDISRKDLYQFHMAAQQVNELNQTYLLSVSQEELGSMTHLDKFDEFLKLKVGVSSQEIELVINKIKNTTFPEFLGEQYLNNKIDDSRSIKNEYFDTNDLKKSLEPLTNKLRRRKYV